MLDTIKIGKGNVKMIAHRGLSGLEKENTCPAFVAAANRSYFGIETDIHKTTDGQYVIIHDETTRRITNDAYVINVEENPYSAVKDIVLPDVDGSTVRQDIKIPLLADYLSICKKYEKKAVLEFKNSFPQSDIEEVIAIIKEAGYLENMIFISFNFENCRILRKLLPEHDIQWLLAEEITDRIIGILDEYRLNLDSAHQAITKEVVDKVHAIGLTVNCWTVNTKEVADRVIACGVDYITTNILE